MDHSCYFFLSFLPFLVLPSSFKVCFNWNFSPRKIRNLKPPPGVRFQQLNVGLGWGMPRASGCGAKRTMLAPQSLNLHGAGGRQKWAPKSWVCSSGQARRGGASGRKRGSLHRWCAGEQARASPDSTFAEVERAPPLGLTREAVLDFSSHLSTHSGVALREYRSCKNGSAVSPMSQFTLPLSLPSLLMFKYPRFPNILPT